MSTSPKHLSIPSHFQIPIFNPGVLPLTRRRCKVSVYTFEQVSGYRLQTFSDRFGLKTSNSSMGGIVDLRLVLLRALDREQQGQYVLQLLAFDGGVPRLTGSLDIYVTVLDVNDNSPRFRNSSYETSVSESAPAGTIVLRVQADDKDSGLNGEVR